MSNDILAVLEYMEKEKGIGRQDMIATISSAIRNAAQKGVSAGQDIKVEIDPRNGHLKAWVLLRVADPVGDPATEIHIEKARAFKDSPQIGDIVEKEIDPSYLGRIAAQTARQAIMQRIRQFEKERIYEDFKDLVGDIISGVVRRRERNDLIVDLGKAEAVLPAHERVPGEDYSPGERIRCLLLNIENTPRGPELILSRSNVRLVRRLFELEVTEIADGTVKIESIAREPGYRAKICVSTTDPKVDPVGACVGARGARVKSIVRELGGEKIDIIRWWADPRKMLEEAIKPAIPQNIRIDEQNRRIYFEVSEDGLSVAIGRRGQNAKLTSRILGWKLDISKVRTGERTQEELIREAVTNLARTFGISSETAQRLVDMGINAPSLCESVAGEDLVEAGFSEEDAADIVARFQSYLEKHATS